MKIGVFICHCGSNIAGTVDCGKVAEIARTYPDVAFSTDTMYTCSEPGQEEIVAAIKEHHLDGVVVASCTPRMHEPTFRRTVERAGLNKYMFEMANIREHVSWIGKDKEANTNKAAELVRIAVEKLRRNNPLFSKSFESTKRVLVIGGGVAGIQAALDCADAGLDVLLVERESHIGGKMAKLDKTFPTVDCSSCILGPKMVDVAQHPKITLMAASEVTNVAGYALGSWPNVWAWNSRYPSAYGSGYTRVGDWVQFMTYPGASVVNWCRANASNHSYITQHWNSYMPQFKRCVASWNPYWKGANAYHNGAATAWIMGRPYEVNEAIKPETFMRSDDVTSEYGYDDHTDTTAQEQSLGAKLKLSGTTTGYYEEEGSGYRFTLRNEAANDSVNTGIAFRMQKAYFATESIPFVEKMVKDPDTKQNVKAGEYANFTTESVAVSKGLFDAVAGGAYDGGDKTGIVDFNLYFRAYGATADDKLSIPGDVLIALASGSATRYVTDPATGVRTKNPDGSFATAPLTDESWIDEGGPDAAHGNRFTAWRNVTVTETAEDGTESTTTEKKVVAYHEIGHALVAAMQSHSAPVQKITIIPRTSGALGYTMQVEAGDKVLMTRQEIENKIATFTGGRAAEEIVFGEITTGASNDIEQATRLARAMITRYGMSEKFDMVAMETVTNQYLGGDTSLMCSADTQKDIDRQVVELVKGQHEKARKILTENRVKLDELAGFLYEKETITGEEFMDILGRRGNGTPEHPGSGEPGRGADGADASGRKGARANAGAALRGKDGADK